jgi:hypothetical protein
LGLQLKKFSVLFVTFLLDLMLKNSGLSLDPPSLHVHLAQLLDGRVFQRVGEDER